MKVDFILVLKMYVLIILGRFVQCAGSMTQNNCENWTKTGRIRLEIIFFHSEKGQFLINFRNFLCHWPWFLPNNLNTDKILQFSYFRGNFWVEPPHPLKIWNLLFSNKIQAYKYFSEFIIFLGTKLCVCMWRPYFWFDSNSWSDFVECYSPKGQNFCEDVTRTENSFDRMYERSWVSYGPILDLLRRLDKDGQIFRY